MDNELGLIPSDRLLGEDFTRYKLVRRNQFAYNPMRLNVGSLGQWKDDRVGVVSPDYIVFGCREDQLDSDFLDLFRGSAAWKWQIQQSGQGSVRIRYYYRHIAEFWVPRPPLSEQRAIAHVLRTVQRAKEATEKVIAATRQLKASLMRHLFTYGLSSVKEADHVPLTEQGIGLMPEHWAMVKLAEVCDLSTGTTPSTTRAEYYDGSIPFIKTSEIANNIISGSRNFVSKKARQDYGLRLYSPGTVLMAMYGQGKTRGQVAILEIEATTTQNAAAIVPKGELDGRFLWHYLMSQYEILRGMGFHGQISHLNLGYLKDIRVPTPSLREQQRIALMLQAIQGKIEAEEGRSRSLRILFGSLLFNLMTGKLRVKDLDPTDHFHDGTAAG